MRPFLFLALAAACAFAQPAAEDSESKAYGALKQGLEDGNPARRIDAVLAMGVDIAQPRPVELVEGMLKDKDSGVRQAACATLGEMKARTTIPVLEAALKDNAPEVAFAAAKVLYGMGDPAGRQVLIDVLLGDQADASGIVSSSLREARLKLHDPKALLLIGINQGAGFLGPFGAGIPIAERLMKDNQSSGKTVAALLLATDNTEESKNAVKQALSDKNWTVRVAAARAVALRGITPFYADLEALLDDKRLEVQYSAAAAMIRLKQRPRRATQTKGDHGPLAARP